MRKMANSPRSPDSTVVVIPSNVDPDDHREISPFSPSSPAWTPSVATNQRRSLRRKKMEKRRAVLEKTCQKNVENLSKSLILVPFVPGTVMDFASHENLLRQVGLWDFVHLQFDTNLRGDLITQLIANYSKESRVSYVNGARIKVNRADLGRALKLPKKEKGNVYRSSKNVKMSDEEMEFLDKLVSTWLLLHGDMWMMPVEVLNWTSMIKEGNMDPVEWTGLIWFMVEKELFSKTVLEHCYYASHLQCLIRHQKAELLDAASVVDPVDVDEDGDVTVSEEAHRMDECGVDVSLGEPDRVEPTNRVEEVEVQSNVLKDANAETIETEVNLQVDVMEQDSEASHYKDNDPLLNVDTNDDGNCLLDNNASKDEESRDFSESEEEKTGLLIGSNANGCYSEKYNEGMADCLNSEVEKEEEDWLAREGMQQVVDGEEDLMEEDIEGENVVRRIFPQEKEFEEGASEDLLSPIGMHLPESSTAGHFFISERIPINSLHDSACNENKRAFEHVQSDFHHYSLTGCSKKLKNDGVEWGGKSSSDIDIWMDEMHQLTTKYKEMYDRKDHDCQELVMNQEICFAELQQRDAVIQRQKDDLQRKHLEVYKLENELFMMSNLVEGYRKALIGVKESFSAYKSKYQMAQEPLYKDTGVGGLVLTKLELEKQRLSRVEEEKQMLLSLASKVNEFEETFVRRFECFEARIETLNAKLCQLKGKEKSMKETCHAVVHHPEE